MDDVVDQHEQGNGAREDEARRTARHRSEQAGIPCVAPEAGAALELFARLIGARHVAEVGTGGGYSGLWLLAGMDPRGSLTTIEADPERQVLAQRAFADARLSDRVRSMLGPALTVLPRLADGNYDVVFLHAATAEYPDYLAHAKRLLRGGGVLLAAGLAPPRSAAPSDPAASQRDDALRSFLDAVRGDPQLLPLHLPLGDGLLVAMRLPPGSEDATR